jgi:signal transduction histidine kinase
MEQDAAGRPVRILGVCMDLTDKTWIEAQARSVTQKLRAVSRRLVEVQEAERRLLARELHDRVGQALTALGLNLRVVATQLSAESRSALSGQLDECMALVEDTVAAMRGVMTELRPQVLDDYGLLAALRTYSKGFSARTGVHVSVTGTARPEQMPKTVELAMFRIAQEALNNVAKHSRATAVEVSCRGSGERAALTLLDDGIGFDPGQARSGLDPQGWGLIIMRERAESVGASFRVDAAPGRGTRIVVEYPG